MFARCLYASALAVVGAIGLSTSVLAADLPTKAPHYNWNNWNGCHIGLNAGAATANSDDMWSGIAESATGFAVGSAAAFPAAANATLHDTGFIGGVQVGCDYQTGAIVFGGEADIQYGGLDATRNTASAAGPGLGSGNITESFSSHWLSTARGRLGFANGAWLFYGTGGLAIAKVSYSDQICFPGTTPLNCTAGASDSTRAGWTIGAGLEWMFAPNWSAKAEYLYVDLGSTTFTGFNDDAAFPNATIQHSRSMTESIGRFGLNYRFN